MTPHHPTYPPPPPTPPLHDLQTQSTISSLLSSIVSDVELTHSLDTTARTERNVEELERRCLRAESALAEYRAVERRRGRDGGKLADGLARELLGVAAYVEELEG